MLADKQCTTIAIVGSGKIEGYTFVDGKPTQLILKNILFNSAIANRTLSTGCLN